MSTSDQVRRAIEQNARARGAISVEHIATASGFPAGILERHNGGRWFAMIVGGLYEFDNPGAAREFLRRCGEMLEQNQADIEAKVADILDQLGER